MELRLTSRRIGAALTGADTVAPTFIPDLPGVYVVELTIDDGNGGVDTDSVTVTASVMGMTLTLEDPLIGAGRSTNGAIARVPAPPGGLTVTLSLDTGIATVDPIAVFIPRARARGRSPSRASTSARRRSRAPHPPR